MSKQYVFSVVWGNPYRCHLYYPKKLWESPPVNSPCLANHPKIEAKINKIIDRQAEKYGDYGWCVGFEYLEDPNKKQRKWSDEAKFRNRKKRLEQRIRKQFSIPMLYEMELQKRLNANPTYFGIF